MNNELSIGIELKYACEFEYLLRYQCMNLATILAWDVNSHIDIGGLVQERCNSIAMSFLH